MKALSFSIPELDFDEASDDWYETRIRITESDSGYFEHGVEGPIIAAIIDVSAVEVASLQYRLKGPTYEFKHIIRKMVPMNTELIVRAKVIRKRLKIAIMKVEIMDIHRNLLAEGEAKLAVTQKPRHQDNEFIILKPKI